jgi:hypothetical protein
MRVFRKWEFQSMRVSEYVGFGVFILIDWKWLQEELRNDKRKFIILDMEFLSGGFDLINCTRYSHHEIITHQ